MRTGRVDRTSRSQANVFRLEVRVLGSSSPRRTDSSHRSAIEREIHIGFEPEVKWVRPDLNRSRQHPKLVGFLVSGKTGGPRAQTKLPHGPAGSSRMIEGLKTLPRSLVGRPRDRSAERQDFVDEFRVGEDHPAATVPLQAELVQDLAGLFSAARPFDERREGAADDFAARETSDGDDHGLTGTTSAASCARRARAASWGACGGCRGRSTFDRIPGRGSRDRCRSDIGRGRGRSRCGPRPPGP